MTQLIALDLFAGTGWGVACQRLGIRENGVEIMPEAVASRAAAGMPFPARALVTR
jgi:DNA (cytosine-5)-methyltransferase 1